MATSVIGQRAARVEGVEKVTGQAEYAANFLFPGTVWGKALRSPHAYARIKRIDASRARALPGVLAVITAKDIDNRLTGRALYDHRILADDVVRFIGEKVAAVAAGEKDVAEAALDLIEVEYEVLEPLLDPLQAMADGAPVLHPELRSYKGLPPIPEHLKNVQSYGCIERGDLAAGFAQADEIVEGTYFSPMTHQAYLETHAAIVSIAEDGRVHIWAPQKNPFRLREQLAEALGLPEDQVVYEFTRMGGDYGNKGALMDAPLCYYLAKACGRPVRMVMTYTEEFIALSPRHPAYMQLRTGVKRDGTITAHEVHLTFDGGAYGAYKPVPAVDVGGWRKAGGCYRIPSSKIEAFMVYTNHVPGGFMRAPADSQVIFALESHVDEIAARLGMDPLEFRRHNLLRQGDANAIGEVWRDLRAREVLEAAVAGSDYGKPKPRPNVGRGVAITHRHIGGGNGEAILRISADGSVVLMTGTPDAGQGAHVMQRQVAAEVLTLPLERVTVEFGNTDVAPYDPGIGAGRTTHVSGRAVMATAEKAVEELRGWAAELRGWPENELVLEEGFFKVRSPGSGVWSGDGDPGLWTMDPGPPVSFAEAAAAAVLRKGGPLEIRGGYSGGWAEESCFNAQVAEVEVDPETGQVTLLHLSVACDPGTIINPTTAESQMEGGIIQGVGLAFTEEMVLDPDDGRVVNPNFGEYKIPVLPDIPPLRTTYLEDAPGPLPFGGRALGEHGHIPTGPAIANAIKDAAGVRIPSMPFTAEKVYQALQRQNH
ncbi:MAG TPA: xanthine dehydrogenase family protein molybdopterin-binding subunit [Chloroflexota bacterium]|nr:xanthine dehydrogenase family protein molybdopterin-binding subunit [Chloroflexota bacterium]